MRFIRPLVLLLVAATSLPGRAPAQTSAPHADSHLYDILARVSEDNPQAIRILNHEGILVQGGRVRLMGDSVVVLSDQNEFAIAVVDIDSLWVQRGTAARALGVIGAVPCALLVALVAYGLATDPDGGNQRDGPGAAIVGAAIGGVVCGGVGAFLGSFIRLWRLEYPRPVRPGP